MDVYGNTYVTGWTASANFPITPDRFQANRGGWDAFMTRFNRNDSLIYSTYLGGDDDDYGLGIAVDWRGSAYITGYTYSDTSAGFPILNPYQGNLRGDCDAFATKFAPSGSFLVYSTYLGGDSDDVGCGIAVDGGFTGSGSAYVTGYTASDNFPTSYLPDRLFDDAFVTKFSPSGSSLVYSTYLGGNSDDYGNGIVLDISGNAFITGSTFSNDFDTTRNPFQGNQGEQDAFVTKLGPSGTISGTITSAMTESNRIISGPIAGVLVRALQNSFEIARNTTISNGSYSLPNLRAGLYDVEASKVGYVTQTKTDTLVIADQTTIVNFQLIVSPYILIYGNRDGTPMPAAIGSDLRIPVWGATERGNTRDSVTFMHLPLSSNDTVVWARSGGYFPDMLVGLWDDREFLAPTPDMITGYTNQSMLGLALLQEPRDPQNFFWTNGDTVRICTFVAQIVYNPSLVGKTLSPFQGGFDPTNGGLLWGMEDGIGMAIPATTYPQVYFLQGAYFRGKVEPGPRRVSLADSLSDSLAGVYVWAINTENYDTTGIDGRYFLGWFVPGVYDLLFTKEGFNDTIVTGVTGVASETTVVDVIMRPYGTCAYLPGDINGDDHRGGGDVTYGVRYFKLIGHNPPDSCYDDAVPTPSHWLYVAGDVNGNCEFRGSDISRLVAYFKLIAPLQYCHFFPPPPSLLANPNEIEPSMIDNSIQQPVTLPVPIETNLGIIEKSKETRDPVHQQQNDKTDITKPERLKKR